MRGSVYYQTGQLIKLLFKEGTKKKDRINPKHSDYQTIPSYVTAESYRNVWNNFFNYLREHWKVKACEKIRAEHVAAYMDYKIEYYPSRQYLEKISSAMGKLEVALNKHIFLTYGDPNEYDFSIRHKILQNAKNLKLVADNYHNRAYENPLEIISLMVDLTHEVASKIQLEGGARIEAVTLIKVEQLRGYLLDEITQEERGVVFTKEKGGKEGNILIHVQTYKELESCIDMFGIFKVDRQAYLKAIRDACKRLHIDADGSHGFRWNFAKRRMFEHAQAGYTYEQSLQMVSWEMKHNRASITTHYLGC